MLPLLHGCHGRAKEGELIGLNLRNLLLLAITRTPSARRAVDIVAALLFTLVVGAPQVVRHQAGRERLARWRRLFIRLTRP
jgi:hypothetical protein